MTTYQEFEVEGHNVKIKEAENRPGIAIEVDGEDRAFEYFTPNSPIDPEGQRIRDITEMMVRKEERDGRGSVEPVQTEQPVHHTVSTPMWDIIDAVYWTIAFLVYFTFFAVSGAVMWSATVLALVATFVTRTVARS